MTRPDLRRVEVVGKTPFVWQELVTDLYGALITQLLITNIDVRVFDGEDEVGQDFGLDPTLHVFDTLQTTHGWDLPDGFNFEYVVASDLFERENGHSYLVEATLETGDPLTGPIFLRLQADVVPILSGVI